MKKYFNRSMVPLALMILILSLQSCSLDENNPGGFTMDNMAENSVSSYETLVNQCYFGMERYLYGTDGFMELTEGDTDLWTYRANQNSSSTQYFWYFAGASPNTTYINGIWNSIYDGIGSCNLAISMAPKAPYTSDSLRNEKVAEAKFLRAVYYFNAVEQFGAVTKITEPASSMDFSPAKTDPLTIYKEVIIPDLEYAVKWLNKGNDATTTTPTKKAALGMLAKVCLQTYEYGTSDYLDEGYQAAKKLIDDCEAGGGTYGAYMYPSLSDVFKESNNYNNKEALWKHRWYAGDDGHGSSNGNYKLNRNDEKFLCCLSKFGAREDNEDTRLTWGGSIEGDFMPTQHLINLFVQADGKLDPRFHEWFSTEWNANKNFTWDNSTLTNYKKSNTLSGQAIKKGDLAIKFVVPQDPDYNKDISEKSTCNYLLVSYNDVYNDANKNVIMTNNSGNENLFRYFYPSLNKHNSSNYYVANYSKKRNGNLDATFIMRMSEVYLIAAEIDLYKNNAPEALTYINKIRKRAGTELLAGTPTVRDILDERGRELCGEYCRFYDLKRTGMLKNSNYLQETHPDLAQYFKPEFALRPISTTFTSNIKNGSEYQNPGY